MANEASMARKIENTEAAINNAGTSIASGKSIVDAIGHDGTTDKATGVSGELAVPAANNTSNAYVRDVVGNMTDTSVETAGTNKTLTAYQKGALTVVGSRADATSTTINTGTSLQSYAKGLLTDTQYIARTTLPGSPVAGTINDKLTQSIVTGTATVTAAGGTTEQTILNNTTAQGDFQFQMDMSALVQTSTIKVYLNVNSTGLKVAKIYSGVTHGGANDPAVFYSDRLYITNGIKVTVTQGSAEAVDRTVNYQLIGNNR